jgi:hypothetical protein
MAARPCYILEYEAQELLRAEGYKTHIQKKSERRDSLPLCVVAFREPGETRYVRICTAGGKIPTPAEIEERCAKEITLYRKIQARSPGDAGRHCEIWFYAVRTGFHCYEVLADSIQKIPTPAPVGAGPLHDCIRCPVLRRGLQ